MPRDNDYGYGNWFHSRSSSSEDEVLSIVKLVNASKNNTYSGVRWSGSKQNAGVIRFANEIGVNPSTMQTKIRSFIRFGFLIDKNECPLEWTTLGDIWQNLIQKKMTGLAKYVEKLIIASSLAIYSFDSNGYTKNPYGNYRPVYELFLSFDPQGFISEQKMKNLIDQQGSRSNYAYWIKDLIRSGLVIKHGHGFKKTDTFKYLQEGILNISLPSNLTELNWEKIHNNALSMNNPYRNYIIRELDIILENIIDKELLLPREEISITEKISSFTDDIESKEIEDGDYKAPDSYSKTKIRKKQSAWSKKVKNSFENKCCMPECDIGSPFLVFACHIKSYSAEEIGDGHRANPKNGLCLCALCHVLFDNGYFTLTDDYRIDMSNRINEINSEKLKVMLLASNGKKINPLPSNNLPKQEFIKYHRENVFII